MDTFPETNKSQRLCTWKINGWKLEDDPASFWVSTCFFSRTVLDSERRDNFMQAVEAIPWIFPIFTRDLKAIRAEGRDLHLGNQTGHVEEAGNC